MPPITEPCAAGNALNLGPLTRRFICFTEGQSARWALMQTSPTLIKKSNGTGRLRQDMLLSPGNRMWVPGCKLLRNQTCYKEALGPGATDTESLHFTKRRRTINHWSRNPLIWARSNKAIYSSLGNARGTRRCHLLRKPRVTRNPFDCAPQPRRYICFTIDRGAPVPPSGPLTQNN